MVLKLTLKIYEWTNLVWKKNTLILHEIVIVLKTLSLIAQSLCNYGNILNAMTMRDIYGPQSTVTEQKRSHCVCAFCVPSITNDDKVPNSNEEKQTRNIPLGDATILNSLQTQIDVFCVWYIRLRAASVKKTKEKRKRLYQMRQTSFVLIVQHTATQYAGLWGRRSHTSKRV